MSITDIRERVKQDDGWPDNPALVSAAAKAARQALTELEEQG